MKRFFSALPLLQGEGIGVVRIIVGMLLIYHGIEVFDPALMKGYVQNNMVTGPKALLMVYAGKSSELLSGTFMLLGFLTRVAALMMVGTFSYITFLVGEGRFWYQEQHPFMFALFGVLYLFTGPGGWSIDAVVFNKTMLR
jgi:putative oxidoreductase